jgi:hypothetical protein
MADVSKGPVSGMPGSFHRVPLGMECDDHPGTLAVKRMQGETDSFGCEYVDMCQVCYDTHKAMSLAYVHIGVCDWCKTPEVELRKRRDTDEGMAGRLYDVCDSCISKDNQRAVEEMEHNDSRDDFGYQAMIDDDYDEAEWPDTRPPEEEPVFEPPVLTDVIDIDALPDCVTAATRKGLLNELFRQRL